LKQKEFWIIASFEELDYRTMNSELFKAITSIADAVAVSDPLPEKSVLSILKKKFSESGREISEGALKLIVELVGTDLQALKTETDKLLAYPGELTAEVVKELLFSTPNVNAFELVFHYLNEDRKGFLKGVNAYLSSGGDPLMLLGLLQSQVRSAVLLKSGEKVRMPKDAASKLKRSVQLLSVEKLLCKLKRLHEAEFSIKRGASTPEEALKSLIPLGNRA